MQKYSIPIFWWRKMDWMFLWKIQISVHEKDTILLYVANNLLASSVRSAVWSYHTIKINANEYIIFHTNNWVLRICFGLNSSEEIQTLVDSYLLCNLNLTQRLKLLCVLRCCCSKEQNFIKTFQTLHLVVFMSFGKKNVICYFQEIAKSEVFVQ